MEKKTPPPFNAIYVTCGGAPPGNALRGRGQKRTLAPGTLTAWSGLKKSKKSESFFTLSRKRFSLLKGEGFSFQAFFYPLKREVFLPQRAKMFYPQKAMFFFTPNQQRVFNPKYSPVRHSLHHRSGPPLSGGKWGVGWGVGVGGGGLSKKKFTDRRRRRLWLTSTHKYHANI